MRDFRRFAYKHELAKINAVVTIESEFRVVLPAPGGGPLRLSALPPPLATPPRPAGGGGLAALAAVPSPARVALGRHDLPLVRSLQVRVIAESTHSGRTFIMSCHSTYFCPMINSGLVFQAAPGHDVPRIRQLQGRQDEERQRIRKSLTFVQGLSIDDVRNGRGRG